MTTRDTTDNVKAALAAALRALPDINVEWYAFPDRNSRPVTIEELCAAILAAEPRLTLAAPEDAETLRAALAPSEPKP